MKMLDILKSQTESYLEGKITLPTLREWFAPYSIDPESEGDADFTRISYELMGDLSDIDDGFLSEEDLKGNLKAAFDSQFASSSVKVQLSFGVYAVPQARSARAGSSVKNEPAVTV
jgi:hypothetical protein